MQSIKTKARQKLCQRLILFRKSTATRPVEHIPGASKELWLFWVQFKKLDSVDRILYRKKQLESSGHLLQQLIVTETQIPTFYQ